MVRLALTALSLLAVAGCGKAARESDDPKPGAAPPAEAVAEASVATAAEPPAAFLQCKICHTTQPGQHLVGPSLAGVYGKPAASAAGYPYSAALKQAGLSWDDATLDRFLTAPMKAVPGTRMTYAGQPDPAARREIIAYLKTI
jgi:cytochrome c